MHLDIFHQTSIVRMIFFSYFLSKAIIFKVNISFLIYTISRPNFSSDSPASARIRHSRRKRDERLKRDDGSRSSESTISSFIVRVLSSASVRASVRVLNVCAADNRARVRETRVGLSVQAPSSQSL